MAAATLLALCLGLSACGSSSSSTTTAAAKSEPTQNQPGEGAKPQLSQPAGEGKGSGAKRGKGGAAAGGEEVIPPQLKRQAGSAAPFLVPNADNSIPTYGSEGSTSQAAEAAAALDGYLVARERGSWAKACALTSAALQRQVGVLATGSGARPGSCAHSYLFLSRYSSKRERANVFVGPLVAFRLKGGRGFALFYGPGRQQFMMPMTREDGKWKVSQSIPVAYPVGAPLKGG